MSTGTEHADPHLVRANRLDLIERLADDLAHEIKNPLHSMVINLEVLRRRVGRQEGEVSGELLRYVGVLGGELERLNQRIELLLRLVRPDRWGEPTTLNDVITELQELIRLEARHHDVEVRFDLQVQAARITVPRESMRQVVLNLVLAAFEQLPAGSVLHLRTVHEPNAARMVLEGADPTGASLPFELSEPDTPSPGLAVARALAEGTYPGAAVHADGTLVLVLPGA